MQLALPPPAPQEPVLPPPAIAPEPAQDPAIAPPAPQEPSQEPAIAPLAHGTPLAPQWPAAQRAAWAGGAQVPGPGIVQWRCETDLPARRAIVVKLWELLHRGKRVHRGGKRVRYMILHMEAALYCAAPSLEKYSDLRTLLQRLRQITAARRSFAAGGAPAPVVAPVVACFDWRYHLRKLTDVAVDAVAHPAGGVHAVTMEKEKCHGVTWKRLLVLHLGLMVSQDDALKNVFDEQDFFSQYLGAPDIVGAYEGMFPNGWHGMVRGPARRKDGNLMYTTATDPNPLERVNPVVTRPISAGLRRYRFKTAALAALLPFVEAYARLARCAVDKKAIVDYLRHCRTRKCHTRRQAAGKRQRDAMRDGVDVIDVDNANRVMKVHRAALLPPSAAASSSSAASSRADLLECQVCNEQERDTLLRPCNHVSLCSTCAASMASCPICRRAIEGRERVHIS